MGLREVRRVKWGLREARRVKWEFRAKDSEGKGVWERG